MNKRLVQVLRSGVAVVGLIGLCSCVVTPAGNVAEEKPKKARKKASASVQPVRVGKSYAWQGFPLPCNSPDDAQILIEKEAPREVRLNEEYTYELKVSNRSKYPVANVMITDTLPEGFRMLKVSPMPAQQGQELQWDLGTMSPQQVRRLRVTGKAVEPGRMSHSGGARLNFAYDITTVVDAVEPMLELKAEGSTDVVISDPIDVLLEVRNDGTAPAKGAKIECTLPKGLLTKEGKSKIDLPVGNLASGEALKFDLSLMASAVGTYETRFVATAVGGLTRTASVRTTVRKPKLRIDAQAPKMRFVGNMIRYEITLTNIGDADARETEIRQMLADGTSLAAADEGGQADGNAVVWKVGTLKPNETKKVSARVVGKRIMMARSTVSAKAKAANDVEAAMMTDIQGIAALLLEVGDINDPVPVGDTETYVIQTTNQGSLPATQITVSCVLEDSMEYVKASGASKCQPEGNVLKFEPLPALDPQGKAVWEVTIKALEAGDVRFRVSVESGQLERPVQESEATHFYR